MGVSYEFERCLGRGGFGEVYLATRRAASGMEQRCAVKVLRVGLRDRETAVQRLKDEARLLAALDHPVILKIIELTTIDGRIALVTEYIDGADLNRFVVAGRLLPPTVVMRVWSEVAHALNVAWTTPSPETGAPLRLVHRDIKPENIRLSRHGAIKLLDFGIARSEQLEREARTKTGHMAFTPGYTAPEAFLTLKQEGPGDVFALASTSYRLLVGSRFFEGLRLSAQAALCASERRFDRHVSARLDAVSLVPEVRELLRDCLQWNPNLRPTAAEVAQRADRIGQALDGPSLRRWLRSARLPPERDVDGAALTGRVFEEDDPSTTTTFAAFPPPPPVPEGLVSAQPELRQAMTMLDVPRHAMISPSEEGLAPAPAPLPSGPPLAPRLGVIVAGFLLGVGAALIVVGLITLLAGGLWMI